MLAASRVCTPFQTATLRPKLGGSPAPHQQKPICPMKRTMRGFHAPRFPKSASPFTCSASQSPASSSDTAAPLAPTPSGKSVRRSTWDPFDDAVAKVIEKLKHELPLVYKESLDYSMLSEDILFVDPLVRLEGRMNYWGMMESLKLMAMGFQNPTFDVLSLEEVELTAVPGAAYPPNKLLKQVASVRALRLKWSTEADSFWGGRLYMSGDDILRIGHDGKISVHESSWDQDPADILRKMVNADWS